MALQSSVQVCGAQLSFNYNAGNGRATSVELTTPISVRYQIALTDGSVIDTGIIAPGSYSWPLPANLVRITFAGGEATYTGLVSIRADT